MGTFDNLQYEEEKRHRKPKKELTEIILIARCMIIENPDNSRIKNQCDRIEELAERLSDE